MIPALLLMATSTNAPTVAEPFPLSQVRLLDGPFKQAMDRNASYLKRLEADRLLHGFRKNAGLEPKAPIYGGWESMGVAGHTLGHYLSACSQQYAASGDGWFRARVSMIVDELAECQTRRTDDYVGAIPDGDRVWDEIRRGEIRSQGFDLNGLWVPWYTQHKVFAGLLDAYHLTGNRRALAVATKLADWAIDVTKGLSDEQWQRMLACEHGGMNESLAEIYAITKEPKYLALSRKFHHDAVLNPLENREDRLAGLHSNTQIPKLIGLARLYELEGKAQDRTAAEFFWDRIVNHRSYVIGGNSNHEHLTQPDRLNDQLSNNTAETCNTYNMLKLTRHLFGWQPRAGLFDFYERAMINHILTSQNPEDGMLMYFIPLTSGAKKPFSTPFDSFWCCVGTGIENHAKYGESIYFRSGDRLYVNLFVPSTLDWRERGARIRQETRFPFSDQISLLVEKASGPFTLLIRKPSWLSGRATILVNGSPAGTERDGYFSISREWKQGDRVTATLPSNLRTEAMPDNPKRIAILKGPVVLAAVLGEGSPEPVIVDGGRPLGEWLKAVEGQPLTYRSKGAVRPVDLEFRPFHQIVDEKYAVYLDRFTPDEWQKREAEIRAEEQRLKELEARTTDVLRVGEMQPERDHNFTGEKVETGEHGGRKWRHAIDGGWFSFEMKIDPAAEHELLCSYWGSDGGGRAFEILVDGARIAEKTLSAEHPGRFFEEAYALPLELTKGKNRVTVRFQAKPGNIAGGLYGCRVVKSGSKSLG
ncbi:MAG TPA: beta-L-arabinofuranosidase domain-containing protein [Fimbriimonas sp.]